MMTTSEAAKRVGVPAHQLLAWQRGGWLTPKSNGKDGQGRRLDWSNDDVEKAKEMKNQDSTKSAAEAIIDSLGGQEFIDHLQRARQLSQRLSSEEVVFAGPRGCHIAPRNSLVSTILAHVGEPAIMLARPSLA